MGDVDAGRRARHADAQLEGGRQRLLVKANGGIQHARRIGGVDLQRGVVSGDDAEAGGAAEEIGDGDRQRRALFGIGGRAELKMSGAANARSRDAR